MKRNSFLPVCLSACLFLVFFFFFFFSSPDHLMQLMIHEVISLMFCCIVFRPTWLTASSLGRNPSREWHNHEAENASTDLSQEGSNL